MGRLKISDFRDIERVCRDYRDGKSMQEIGDVFFVDEQTISRILKRNGVPIRKKTVTLAVRAHNWEISLKQKGRLRRKYKTKPKKIS